MNICLLDYCHFMHIRPHMLGKFTSAFGILMLVLCLSISVNMFMGLEDESVFSFTKNMGRVRDNPVQWCWKTPVTRVFLLPGNSIKQRY